MNNKESLELVHSALEGDSLAHHGIMGQKWGRRNGPPYPLSPGAHSSAEKKANWEQSLDKKKPPTAYGESNPSVNDLQKRIDSRKPSAATQKILRKQIKKLSKKGILQAQQIQELSKNAVIRDAINRNPNIAESAVNKHSAAIRDAASERGVADKVDSEYSSWDQALTEEIGYTVSEIFDTKNAMERCQNGETVAQQLAKAISMYPQKLVPDLKIADGDYKIDPNSMSDKELKNYADLYDDGFRLDKWGYASKNVKTDSGNVEVWMDARPNESGATRLQHTLESVGVKNTKAIEKNIKTLEKEAVEKWLDDNYDDFKNDIYATKEQLKRNMIAESIFMGNGFAQMTLGLSGDLAKENPWFGMPNVEFYLPNNDVSKRKVGGTGYDD